MLGLIPGCCCHTHLDVQQVKGVRLNIWLTGNVLVSSDSLIPSFLATLFGKLKFRSEAKGADEIRVTHTCELLRAQECVCVLTLRGW